MTESKYDYFGDNAINGKKYKDRSENEESLFNSNNTHEKSQEKIDIDFEGIMDILKRIKILPLSPKYDLSNTSLITFKNT